MSTRPDTPIPSTTLFRTAGRGHADAHVLGRFPGGRIADPLALADAIDRKQAGGEGHHGLQAEDRRGPARDHGHPVQRAARPYPVAVRSEVHTSELQSLMRISYDVFCWKKKKQ